MSRLFRSLMNRSEIRLSTSKILPVEQKYSFAEQPTIFLEIIYSYTLQTRCIIIMLMRRSNISFSSIVKILLMDDFLPGRTFYWNYVLSPPLVDWIRWKQMKKETCMRLFHGEKNRIRNWDAYSYCVLYLFCLFF